MRCEGEERRERRREEERVRSENDCEVASMVDTRREVMMVSYRKCTLMKCSRMLSSRTPRVLDARYEWHDPRLDKSHRSGLLADLAERCCGGG